MFANYKSIIDGPTVWVSMAVCWSGNTAFHKKEKFPYQAATKLSSSLWTVKTKYRPLVYVVYDAKAKDNEERSAQLFLSLATDLPCAAKSGDDDRVTAF